MKNKFAYESACPAGGTRQLGAGFVSPRNYVSSFAMVLASASNEKN